MTVTSLITRKAPETASEHAARLDREARDAGRKVFASALQDLSQAADGADAICDLKSIDEAQRNRLRKLATYVAAELDGLRAVDGRLP